MTIKDYAVLSRLSDLKQTVADLNNAIAETDQAITDCVDDTDSRLVLNTQARTLRTELAKAVNALDSYTKAVNVLGIAPKEL